MKGETHHYHAPGKADAGQERTRAELPRQDCRGRLEEGVRDEEDQRDCGLFVPGSALAAAAEVGGNTYVSEPFEHLQINPHAGNGSIGQVGAVHETVHVDDAGDGDEAPIEAVDDLALLLVGVDGIIVDGLGRSLAVLEILVEDVSRRRGLLDLLPLGLDIGGGHGCEVLCDQGQSWDQNGEEDGTSGARSWLSLIPWPSLWMSWGRSGVLCRGSLGMSTLSTKGA